MSTKAEEALARIEAIMAEVERLTKETGGIYHELFRDEAHEAGDDCSRIMRTMARSKSKAAE